MNIPIRLVRCEWPPNEAGLQADPQFGALLESIRHEGIREPLTINLKWSLMDGAHRLSAARLLGIEVVPVRVWTGVEFVE